MGRASFDDIISTSAMWGIRGRLRHGWDHRHEPKGRARACPPHWAGCGMRSRDAHTCLNIYGGCVTSLRDVRGRNGSKVALSFKHWDGTPFLALHPHLLHDFSAPWRLPTLPGFFFFPVRYSQPVSSSSYPRFVPFPDGNPCHRKKMTPALFRRTHTHTLLFVPFPRLLPPPPFPLQRVRAANQREAAGRADATWLAYARVVTPAPAVPLMLP